jgi:hypothetical protein
MGQVETSWRGACRTPATVLSGSYTTLDYLLWRNGAATNGGLLSYASWRAQQALMVPKLLMSNPYRRSCNAIEPSVISQATRAICLRARGIVQTIRTPQKQNLWRVGMTASGARVVALCIGTQGLWVRCGVAKHRCIYSPQACSMPFVQERMVRRYPAFSAATFLLPGGARTTSHIAMHIFQDILMLHLYINRASVSQASRCCGCTMSFGRLRRVA